MRPGVSSHCRPSRNCQDGDLRAGTVKARRPRASAVEAKRRALHGAEHRASMDRVMAGASAVVQIESRFGANSSGTNGIRLSGQCGPDRRAHVSLILRRFRQGLRTRGQSTRDSDTHGVSDPPDRRGAIASARARVAHAMSPALIAAPVPAQWAAKNAAHRAGVAPSRWNLRPEHRLSTVLAGGPSSV